MWAFESGSQHASSTSKQDTPYCKISGFELKTSEEEILLILDLSLSLSLFMSFFPSLFIL